MGVEIPIQLSFSHLLRAATDDANCWRAQCIDKFAQMEAAIDRCLLAIEDSGRDSALRRPATFGARITALREALYLPRPLAAGESKLRNALAKLELRLDVRNGLVHSCGSVMIDGQRRWHWRGDYIAQGKERAPKHLYYSRDEAEAMGKELSALAHSLCALLDNLAKKAATPEY